jgi:hypothetical protein
MTKCKPDCVTTVSGTNREKWDYMRNLYFGGGYVETRAVDDEARIAEETALTTLFNEDETNWQAKAPNKPFEKWLEWKYRHGTEAYANLPERKKTQHVGHIFAPCPYSTESTDLRSEHMLGSIPTKVTHTVGGLSYYMETAYQGKWGYKCPYDGCPYYLLNGIRYFYG